MDYMQVNKEAVRLINNGLFEARDWGKMRNRLDVYRHILQNSIVRYNHQDMADIAEEIADLLYIEKRK